MRFRIIPIVIFLSLCLLAPGASRGADPYAPATQPAQQEVVDLSFYRPPAEGTPYPTMAGNNVRSVILMIGDGMGLTQVTAARIKSVGPDGRLYIDRMPVTALITTHSADWLVTDSAAAGTALATGRKTNNAMLSMAPDETALQTTLEAAQARNMSTGIIVTADMTDATPAAFAAHVKSRNDHPAIAHQLLQARINVLLGGGRALFAPKPAEGSTKPDQGDLLKQAKQIGYDLVNSREELLAARGKYVLGLFQLGNLTTHPPEPALAEMTAKGIALLSRGDAAFFLMVEGSLIDGSCHGNDAMEAIRQTLLFDMAVGEALTFAQRDQRTLVVVTGDHETGGMAINDGTLDARNLVIAWTTKGHTGTAVPLYAFGPGAATFTGLHDNTDIPKMISHLLKVETNEH